MRLMKKSIKKKLEDLKKIPKKIGELSKQRISELWRKLKDLLKKLFNFIKSSSYFIKLSILINQYIENMLNEDEYTIGMTQIVGVLIAIDIFLSIFMDWSVAAELEFFIWLIYYYHRYH